MTPVLPALVEGHLEAAVLPVIFRQIGLPDAALVIRVAGGGDRFWREAVRYNAAARHRPVVGLADLERAACVPRLLDRLPGGRHASFHLRLAVRMLEAWLMADRPAMSRLLGVRSALLPERPDEEPHPKRKLMELAQLSRRRAIRQGLVPAGTGASVGPEYVALMTSFARQEWRVDEAVRLSPSLSRACTRWRSLTAG